MKNLERVPILLCNLPNDFLKKFVCGEKIIEVPPWSSQFVEISIKKNSKPRKSTTVPCATFYFEIFEINKFRG